MQSTADLTATLLWNGNESNSNILKLSRYIVHKYFKTHPEKKLFSVAIG